MADLSVALTEAAAEAAGGVALKYDGPPWSEMDSWQRAAMTDLAAAAAAAVLETLAAGLDDDPLGTIEPAELRRLAAEVRAVAS